MSVDSSAVKEIGKIASRPCSDTESEGIRPSPEMKEAMNNASGVDPERASIQLLTELQYKIEDIQNLTESMSVECQADWVVRYTNAINMDQLRTVVMHSLLITRKDSATEMSEEENRLRTLIQLAIYVNFLSKQENEEVYGISKTTKIRTLKIKIKQATCVMRRLLPDVTNDKIEELVEQRVTQDLSSQMITLSDTLRRIVFTLGIETILHTFNTVQVSTENGSISIP